jgi:spermidine synthase
MKRKQTMTERSRERRGESSSAAISPARRGFFSEQACLYVVVFWSGAILMALEITGSRVLAPYFGNSVYVWGSLISIFLLAISVGNYVGGLVADDYPLRTMLNAISAAVSLWIIGVALVGRGVCDWLVTAGAGEQTGPLLASSALFLPPSIGMGMISPFAIRLAARSVASVGKTSGTFYALSTFGSIAGTLVTTFGLIPMLGVSTILKGLGVTLLLVSVATFPFLGVKRSSMVSIVVVFLAAIMIIADEPARGQLAAGETTVAEVESPYHHITVVDNHRQDSRDLRFDKYVETSIRKSPPHVSLADYTNYFHLAFLVNPTIHRALFIGAGGAVGPRTFHRHDAEMLIDVVDIDPKVLALARSHFFLDDSPKIRTIAEDGRTFLRHTSDQYDCIILDAFTIGGRIPFHLVTREFFASCHDKMTPDGVLVMNINSAVEGPTSRIFHSVYRTLAAVFPAVDAFARDYQAWGSRQSVNILLVASKNPRRLAPQEWAKRADEYSSASHVTRDQVSGMIDDLVVPLPDMAAVPIFTDDYAPIETMRF